MPIQLTDITKAAELFAKMDLRRKEAEVLRTYASRHREYKDLSEMGSLHIVGTSYTMAHGDIATILTMAAEAVDRVADRNVAQLRQLGVAFPGDPEPKAEPRQWTLDEFRATRQFVTNLGPEIGDDSVEGEPGFTYLGVYWIAIRPSGQFHTLYDRDDILDGDLGKVESWLYANLEAAGDLGRD